jgi:YteA family regulatory protein
MLTQQQLNEFHSQLLNEKKEIEEQQEKNDDYGLERGHYHESVGELSSIDNHPADEGTELYEREKDIALSQHSKLQIYNINKALKAIEQGAYGKCEVCGEEIPLERLKALPNTTYCMEHTPDKEISHDRPVEEEVLMFGKFDMDQKHENVAFDAEDSWQIVAQWGTSETPSDFAIPQEHYNDVNNEPDENDGYVEDYENFVGNDLYGENITVYPSPQHKRYERELDEEGIMTSFGDLPAFEHDPYVEDDKK